MNNIKKEEYRVYIKDDKFIDLAHKRGFTKAQAKFLERMLILMSGGQWKEPPEKW